MRSTYDLWSAADAGRFAYVMCHRSKQTEPAAASTVQASFIGQLYHEL